MIRRGIFDKMKATIRGSLPRPIWNLLSRGKKAFKDFYFQSIIKMSRSAGLDVYPSSDFYSPLPSMASLEKNMDRWCGPSQMVGIDYDVGEMKKLLIRLQNKYSDEYTRINEYKKHELSRYGPGFTRLDAKLLYFMIRDIQPANYIEVGSGLSTKYCAMAAEENAAMGKSLNICCIEPYPYEMLYQIPRIEIIAKEVQSVDLSVFEKLGAGDILFIDSTHIVKIDGDVPFLFLEVVPRLKKGVVIHVHDIPFPYNVPFPQGYYLFDRKLPDWPWFFTEAMLLQAFLSYNESYKIIASIPLLRYHDDDFLRSNITDYISLADYTSENINQHGFPPCSIWLEKVK
jgi:hypothetical protein